MSQSSHLLHRTTMTVAIVALLLSCVQISVDSDERSGTYYPPKALYWAVAGGVGVINAAVLIIVLNLILGEFDVVFTPTDSYIFGWLAPIALVILLAGLAYAVTTGVVSVRRASLLILSTAVPLLPEFVVRSWLRSEDAKRAVIDPDAPPRNLATDYRTGPKGAAAVAFTIVAVSVIVGATSDEPRASNAASDRTLPVEAVSVPAV